MVGEIEFEANLRGDQNVKAKLQALIELQRVGLRATDEQIQKAREASATINSVTRAQSALNRSFLAQHPALSQMIRGMSSLAHVGRSVLSIITSISVARIAALQNQQRERELGQEQINVQKQINDLKAQGVVADDPRLVELEQKLTNINDQIRIAKESAFQDTISDWGNKFAIAAISVGEISTILKNLPVWRANFLRVASGVQAIVTALKAIPPAVLAAQAAIVAAPFVAEWLAAQAFGTKSVTEVAAKGFIEERTTGAPSEQTVKEAQDIFTKGWPEAVRKWIFEDIPKFFGSLTPQAFGEMGGAPNYDYTAGAGTTTKGGVGFGDRGGVQPQLKGIAKILEENIAKWGKIGRTVGDTEKIFEDVKTETIETIRHTDLFNIAIAGNSSELKRLTKLYGEDAAKSVIDLVKQYDVGTVTSKDLDSKLGELGISVTTFRRVLDQLGINFTKFTGVGVGEPNPAAAAAGAPPIVGLHEAMINSAGKSYGYNTGSRVGRTGMPSATPSAITQLTPSDPFYNIYGSYLQAAHPGSISSIQDMMSRGVMFQPNQGDLASAQNWAQRNNLTINVYGSLIGERDLIQKVSAAIAQAV